MERKIYSRLVNEIYDTTRSYSDSDIKRLFAVNVCAFPDCVVKMVDGKIIVGEICHIEGEKPKSPRYNPNMSDKERGSFNNLILFCSTHHTIVDKDPSEYTVPVLKEFKMNHERKHRNNPYSIPDQVLKIVKVSVNYDEYSLERSHNLLTIFKKLKGDETKKEWFEYAKYVIDGLTISKTIHDDVKEALSIVMDDINEFKPNKEIFQELLWRFLERLPKEIRPAYIEKIRPYIEDMKEHDFTNAYFPLFYKYLDKSEVETLEYLIEKAGNLSKDQFDRLLSNLNIGELLKTLTQNQKVFMDFERRLWEMLDSAENKKESAKEEKELFDMRFQNIKTLVNKFATTTS